MAQPARRKRSGPALSPQVDPNTDRMRRDAEAALTELREKVKELEDRIYALENP